MTWSAASASTTASGSRLLASAAAAATAGPESRRIGSITTVASMPMSSAWRRAKNRKSAPVITIGGANRLGIGDAQQGVLVGRALADQRQELLRQGIPRHRPKPGPGAPGQQ